MARAMRRGWWPTRGWRSPCLARHSIHLLRHPDGNVLLFPFPSPDTWRLLDTNPASDPIDAEAQRQSFERRVREATNLEGQVQPLSW